MAAFDAFLKLDGIKGESSDSKHPHEIELLSYSFGATQTGSFGIGGGGGAGKVNLQDFHFTKRADSATATLFKFCAGGDHIKNGLLTVRKAAGSKEGPLEFYKVKFTDILVSSQQISGVGSGDPIPTESISLNFAKIEMEYKPQTATGTGGAAITGGYDASKNKVI
jgi:type VI secretion system secreted protein Hcp